MNLTITAKIKILPNENDKELLLDTIRAVREGLNFASGIAFKHKCFASTKLHELTYRKLRNVYGLKSQMANSVGRTVCAKYKTMKTQGTTDTRANFKKPEYDLVWNRDYSITKEIFSVNTLQGRVKVPFMTKGMEQYFNGKWKFGTAKLVQKKGKFFLHIPMTAETEDFSYGHINNIVGVDLGINFLATAYDDLGKTTFFSGKEVKHKRAQYQVVRKSLQKKQTPSSRRRLKAIGGRENRWMTDVNHQVSKALVDQYGKDTLFVLEDLSNVRNATEKVRRKHRYVSVSWAFGQLKNFLTYKSMRNRSEVILEDPKFTSQTCPKCSYKDKNNRNKKLHIFCCRSCGYTSNDDRIAAMNLQVKGIKYLVGVSA